MESYKKRLRRARRLGFGEGTTICKSALAIGDVHIGKNTWIGPFTVLDGSGGLEIGKNCSISAGVQIYTHDTVKKRLSGRRLGPEREKTKIGHSCYIGPLAVIQKGVTVGNYVVIGAHSFVNRDIPNDSFAYGVPAKIHGSALARIYDE